MIDEGDLAFSILIALSVLVLSVLSKKHGFILVNARKALLFQHFVGHDIRGFSTIAWQVVDSFLYVLSLSTVDC